MNFKQALGSENIYGVFNVFVDVPLKNLSLHIPDESYYRPPLSPPKAGRTGLSAS
mgnify:FL=1